jgi:transposase
MFDIKEDQVTPTHARGRRETPEAESDRKRGRPGLFRPEYVEQARRLCAAGVPDEQIAAYFGVNRSTLHRWQARWPEFSNARANRLCMQPLNGRHRFRLEFIDQVRTLSELSLTNIEIAKLLNIHISTFDRWRRKYPTFGEAVSAGRSAGQQPR